MNVAGIAQRLGAEAKGNEAKEILGLKDLERVSTANPPQNGCIYFVESKKQLKKHPEVIHNEGVCILAPKKLAGDFSNAILVEDARAKVKFIELLQLFEPKTPTEIASPSQPIHSTAVIGQGTAIFPGAVILEGVKVGEGCKIYPGVVLEPFSQIGDNTILYPNVVVSNRCQIGKNCIIHTCTVIGSDGFGFYDDQNKKRYKIPQIGNVVVGDNVEIGASCTVDRATIESTTVGDHTKMDNRVHIAHNCQIGSSIYIAACTGIAGSTIVEDNCIIGDMVALADHIRIKSGTITMSTSGVPQSPEPGIYYGFPARPVRDQHKINASMVELPAIVKKVRKLKTH